MNEEKKKLLIPDLEIIGFSNEDIITLSAVDGEIHDGGDNEEDGGNI